MKRLLIVLAVILTLTSCSGGAKNGTYKGAWEDNSATIEINNNTVTVSYTVTENENGIKLTESVKATGTVEKRENGIYYACFNDLNAKIKAKLTVTGEGAEEYLTSLEKTLLSIVVTDSDKALSKAYCSGKEITYGIESDLYELLPEIPEELEFTLDDKKDTFEIVITQTEE